MANRFYLYRRERAGKSPVWYVKYRQSDGTIGSAILTGKSDKDGANDWAIEHLSDDTAKKTRKPRVQTPKVRGILTPDELRLLFGPGAFEKAWNRDPKHYALNILAASTGLRLGECQALQIQYLHPEYIEVRHSWNDTHGLSAPKSGTTR